MAVSYASAVGMGTGRGEARVCDGHTGTRARVQTGGARAHQDTVSNGSTLDDAIQLDDVEGRRAGAVLTRWHAAPRGQVGVYARDGDGWAEQGRFGGRHARADLVCAAVECALDVLVGGAPVGYAYAEPRTGCVPGLHAALQRNGGSGTAADGSHDGGEILVCDEDTVPRGKSGDTVQEAGQPCVSSGFDECNGGTGSVADDGGCEGQVELGLLLAVRTHSEGRDGRLHEADGGIYCEREAVLERPEVGGRDGVVVTWVTHVRRCTGAPAEEALNQVSALPTRNEYGFCLHDSHC